MISTTRWNPNTQTAYLSRDPFFRLVDTFFGNGATMTPGNEDVSNRSWMPPVDIQETTESYRLFAELPGLTKEDIEITLENNVLRLSGERKFEKDVQKDNFQRIERTYGAFSRSFTLPNQVNAENVQAQFENGVLTITVPKAEQAKPRRISIS